MSSLPLSRSASLASLIALAAACGGKDPVESTQTGATGGAIGGGTGFTGGVSGGVTGGATGVTGGDTGITGGSGGFTSGTGGALSGGMGGGTTGGDTGSGGIGPTSGGAPAGGMGGATGGMGGVSGATGGDTGSGGIGPTSGGASGTGGDTSSGGSSCAQTQCGAACADLQTDVAHCSACDDACTASWSCVGAVCVSPSGGTTYSLELGDPATGEVLFEVSTAGGRVTSYSLDGQSLLTDSTVNATNYGSTMWTSPQTSWGCGSGNWPPPTAIDVDAYTASVTGNVITMTSQGTPSCGPNVQVSKTFTPDAATKSLRIEYSITNTGSTAIELAVWEITRVNPAGYLAWPDAGAPRGRDAADDPLVASVQLIGTNRWLGPRSATITNQKLMADGANGWMAYGVGQMLYVKTWDDVPANLQFSPGEGEVEVYDGAEAYRELEVQGPITNLAGGANTSFSVTWYLRALAAPVTAAGDAAMLAAVAEIVGP